MSNLEQTLSIIKPDAVERNLAEEIKNIFVKNRLNIKDSKKIHITKDEAAEACKKLLAQINNDHASFPHEIALRLHSDQGREFTARGNQVRLIEPAGFRPQK